MESFFSCSTTVSGRRKAFHDHYFMLSSCKSDGNGLLSSVLTIESNTRGKSSSTNQKGIITAFLLVCIFFNNVMNSR